MFHFVHWLLDAKHLTSFMWRKGVYFMPGTDTKCFVSFLPSLPIISCFTHDWNKNMHVVVMETRLAFCPFGCCEMCCFSFMTKKRCSWYRLACSDGRPTFKASARRLIPLDVFRFNNMLYVHWSKLSSCSLLMTVNLCIRGNMTDIILWLREILRMSHFLRKWGWIDFFIVGSFVQPRPQGFSPPIF